MSFESKPPVASQSVGDNPRKTDDGFMKYCALKDLRSVARDHERRQEAQDPSERQMKVGPQWNEIRNGALEILNEIGCDIEIAIWMIEADTRIDSFRGVRNSVGLLTQMVTDHGLMLHPQPEDADDRPFEMIGALNGIGREGTLIQPLRLLSLVPNGALGEACLWSAQTGGEADVAAAIMAAGNDAARRHLDDIQGARRAVAECDAALTDLLGSDAPPFAKIAEILEEAETTLRRLANLSDPLPDDGPYIDASETALGAEPNGPSSSGVIRNRDEAFDQLLRVAGYFRRAEPHSPIADSLETLVRRGRMDFLTLIEELIPDPNARQAVMTTAGIGKMKPTDDNAAN